MSSFTSHGGFTPPTSDEPQWTCSSELVYRIGDPDYGYKIVVKEGEKINFASVGKFLKVVLPARWVYSKASGIHDKLYSKNGKLNKYAADYVFFEAMLVEKIPLWVATLMYLAVFFFGHKSYKAGVTIER